MQDLHADLDIGVGRMDGLRDPAMLGGFGRRRQLAAHAPLCVGGDAAGDDHADAAACALGEERCHSLETVIGFLEAGMHRAHQNTVFQPGEAEVEGRKHMGIAGLADHGDVSCCRI